MLYPYVNFSFHSLFKAEHAVKALALIVVFLACLRIMGIGMMSVEELHDMETALVDIEVDVPGFEEGRAGLSDIRLRVQALYGLPGSIADAFAVGVGRNKQQIQMVVLGCFVDFQHHAAHDLAVLSDAVGHSVADAFFDGLPGNNLPILLHMIVAATELFHRSVFECPLVVQNELFPIVCGQNGQRDVCHVELLSKKYSATNGISQLFRAHSTSYPTGGLQSFRFTIPYATAYCPPMTNILLIYL